jgi:tetratricopeptide (TPR) repeat protein
MFEEEPELPNPMAALPLIDVPDPWVEAFNEEAELAGTDKVPDWYKRNVTDPKRIAAVEGKLESDVSLENTPLLPETELTAGELQATPDWLTEAASDVSVPDWLMSDVDQAEAVPQENVELPDWLKEADVAVSMEDIPDWLRETAEDLVMSTPAAQPTPVVPVPAPVPVAPPAPVFTLSPAPVPVHAAVDAEATLKNARAKYSGGDLGSSLLEYESIIRANTALDAVVNDVARIAEQHKNNPAVYRVLGDGLMRQGKLQAALDTYRKALNQL